MGEIFFLDWNVHTLFGWERGKSDLIVEAIIRGIEFGDDFPAVKIQWWGPLRGYILATPNDGGHNRAIGHYIENKPLKCELVGDGDRNRGRDWIERREWIKIGDHILFDDDGEYKSRKRMFPDYR